MFDKKFMTEIAPVPLRLAVGALLFYHGALMLGVLSDTTAQEGITDFASRLSKSGYGAATGWAWFIAVVDFVGGPLLILGLFVRPISFIVGVLALTSLIFGPHFLVPAEVIGGSVPAKVEIVLLMLGAALSLAALGAGPLSIDSAIAARRARRDTPH